MYRLKRSAIFLLAIALVFGGFITLVQTHKSWSHTWGWNRTEGTVKSFELIRVRRGNWKYDLQFQFVLDGQDYSGELITPDHEDATYIDAAEKRKYSNAFKPGNKIDVFYSPDAPDRESYVEITSYTDFGLPAAVFLLGLWVLYLLRKTRVRKIPKRVLDNKPDDQDPYWHTIYQSALDKEQISIKGTAWYSRAAGLTQWPNSRVGIVATPNHLAVVRGPFTVSGMAAALITLLLEFRIARLLAFFHGWAFAREWMTRKSTWTIFENDANPLDYTKTITSSSVVSIDAVTIYGYDDKYHELWFRLPDRPVDDSIKLDPRLSHEIETFIGFVQLMQRANEMAAPPELPAEASNPEA